MINPFEILSQLFSKDGIAVQEYFTLRFENNIEVKVTSEGDKYNISFGGSKPILHLNKPLRLNLKVSGITLGNTGGILRIDLFPDIPFKYDWVK